LAELSTLSFVAKRPSDNQVRSLLAGARREMRGIPVSLHLDLGEGIRNLAKVAGGQLHIGGRDVLPHTIHLGRARDGYDQGLLRQEPGERDLRWSRLLARSDRPEALDQRLVRLARFG
jgi:hypothetical protein